MKPLSDEPKPLLDEIFLRAVARSQAENPDGSNIETFVNRFEWRELERVLSKFERRIRQGEVRVMVVSALYLGYLLAREELEVNTTDAN